MRVAILHNHDFDALDDPGQTARADVVHVAAAFRDALESRGHRAVLVALGGRGLGQLQALADAPPDVAVNLCESFGGDARGEALVPMALELAGIAYTGSESLALSLALHKGRCKELLSARGVPTPDWVELADPNASRAVALPFPLIVKPSREDASAGIHAGSVVRDADGLERAVHEVVQRFCQPALVERYIEGRELNVALFGAALAPLPLAEIDFSRLPAHLPPIVTYAGKWDEGSLECVATPSVPAELEPALAARAVEVARGAFAALGCRDYGRVDLRVAADGTPFVIDVNPNCDLSPTAGFARAAARSGLDYAQLCEALVELARSRHGAAPAARIRPSLPFPPARADPAVHAR